jgi:hypothetical protein
MKLIRYCVGSQEDSTLPPYEGGRPARKTSVFAKATTNHTKDIEKREKFARRLNRYTQIRNSGHKIAKETKEKPIQS